MKLQRRGWRSTFFLTQDHKYLTSFLAGTAEQKGRSGQELFEAGVIRLMNPFGISAVWYGFGVKDARADAAAIVEDRHKRKRLLAIECTTENPKDEAKYLQLAETLRGFRAKLRSSNSRSISWASAVCASATTACFSPSLVRPSAFTP